ncbi:hypothetical protein QMZ05_39485, partial [Bradyrhizobium sp. INPA03-11B]
IVDRTTGPEDLPLRKGARRADDPKQGAGNNQGSFHGLYLVTARHWFK